MEDSMNNIPTVTADQMTHIDQFMMDNLGVDPLQLMEAAGLVVTEAIRRQLRGDVAGKRLLQLAGTGGNGGDVLVAARHLIARRARPRVVTTKPTSELPPVTAHQCRLVEAFGTPINVFGASADAFDKPYDLIVDGLLGFSGRGNPGGSVAELITRANDHAAPILAIDLPSGLDAMTGVVGGPCLQASTTISLALPKQGFTADAAREYCGEILVGDIGIPAFVVAQAGVTVGPTLFSLQQIHRWQPD